MRLTAMILALCMLAGLACAQGVNNPPPTSTFQKILLKDGITAPATKTGWGQVYVDIADGLVKIKDGAGNVSILDATSAVATHEAGYDHVASVGSASQTNAQRGAALVAAVAAATSGTTLALGPWTYDLTAANIILPAGVNLVGKGMYSTTITSTANLNTIGPVVVPGSGSIVSDLKIINTGVFVDTNGPYQACVGYRTRETNNPVPTSFVLRNLYCVADAGSDVFFVSNQVADSATAMLLEHCIFQGHFDAVAIWNNSNPHVAPTLTFDAYDCRFETAGNSEGANCRGFIIGSAAHVTARLWNCVCSSGGGTEEQSGAAQNLGLANTSANATVEAWGCKLIGTAVGAAEAYDVYQTAGTVTLHGCSYDSAETYGIYSTDNDVVTRASEQYVSYCHCARASTDFTYLSATGLVPTIKGGKAYIAGIRVVVPQTTMAALTDDATNYIYINSDGTMSAYTTRSGHTGLLIGSIVASNGTLGSATDLRITRTASKITGFPTLAELQTRWVAETYEGGMVHVAGDGYYVVDYDGETYAWAKITAVVPE